jgi:hypothetical protein
METIPTRHFTDGHLVDTYNAGFREANASARYLEANRREL